MVFAAVDLPIAGWLPVVDLSTHIKGASGSKKETDDVEAQRRTNGVSKLKFWKRS